MAKPPAPSELKRLYLRVKDAADKGGASSGTAMEQFETTYDVSVYYEDDNQPAQLDDLTDLPEKEPAKMARKTKEQNATLKALRDVSGANFQHSDITFDGTKLIIPERWTTKKAIDTIARFQQAQEEHTEFHRTYLYRPMDGAAATERALRIVTGTPGIGASIPGFFGSTPPQRITIKTGVSAQISVPWGRLVVPLFMDTAEGGDSWVEIGGQRHAEYGTIFSITAWVPKKYEAEVNGLFELIQHELETNSIYRGHAITGASEPEFLDLSGIDPAKVIYSDEVMAQMDAHLWGVIKYSDEMEAQGVSLKRSILFHGPYGTGKTLGLMLTARAAIENGYTFILCRPGKDEPFDVLQTAQLYAPAVVAIEDIDGYSRSEGMSMDKMSELLDKFDGIEAKGARSRIINVMTTNHEGSITKGMLRPGRLDALIEIAHLDRGGVERMVKSLVPASSLDDVDYDLVFDACEGYLPAFVAESVTRAKNASIVRGEGLLLPLNTADLVNGAMSLRPQFELMQKASEVETPATFETAMRATVRNAIDRMDVYVPENEDNWAELRS